MQQFKALFINQRIGVILLLILTGIFIYLRSVNRTLINEEITYFYVFENGDGFESNADAKEIKTFSDILESQVNHYNFVNGRALVHSLEQFFSGIVGVEIFYVLNTFVFIFTIFLFVKIMFIQIDKYKYWIFTIIAFLYLFPDQSKLWLSINLSLNYLWPLCFSLLVLYYWDKLKSNVEPSKVMLAIMPIIGFIAGWSHEAFVVPLSIVIFLYYCFNYKEFSFKIALLVIPYWIGAALLVLAPGNFERIQNEAFNNHILISLKQNPFVVKLLPIMVILVLFIWKKRLIKINSFIKDNLIYIGLLGASLLFVLLLGLGLGRTYIAVELFSLILIVKMIKLINIKYNIIIQYSRPISLIITALFVVHQSFICNATIKEKKYQDDFINQYIKSEDGIAVYDYQDYGCFINPFIQHLQLEIGDNPGFNYTKETIELRYTKRQKRLIPLTSKDYELISNFDRYFNDNIMKYSGPFYVIDGCDYAWAIADSVNVADKFEYHYSPVSFHDEVLPQVKVKRLLMPYSYPMKSMVNQVSEVLYNSRRFLAIRITPNRNVVDIKRVK